MDWKNRLEYDEAILKALIDRLNGSADGDQPDGREIAMRHLAGKLAEMNAFVEDCLSGRTESERSVLLYKLRIEYPLYAHLASLSAMPAEYAEFSVTA